MKICSSIKEFSKEKLPKKKTQVKDAIKGWLHVEEKHGRLEALEEKEVFLGEVTV
jgi:hypothetical protein